MSNEDYVNPVPPTRANGLEPVSPQGTAAEKARLREEAAAHKQADRDHLAGLGHDALVDLCEQSELPTFGSSEHLRARLLGDPEPSGPRFAA